MTPSYTFQLVKKGRRTYGAFVKLPSGVEVYLAFRSHREIFRFGEKSISDALRSGKAAWAFDEETLMLVRARGVKFIGVLVRETNVVYLARLEVAWTPGAYKILNYETKGGALQRYVFLDRFSKSTSKLSVGSLSRKRKSALSV